MIWGSVYIYIYIMNVNFLIHFKNTKPGFGGRIIFLNDQKIIYELDEYIKILIVLFSMVKLLHHFKSRIS
jgi:hypothetical protein